MLIALPKNIHRTVEEVREVERVASLIKQGWTASRIMAKRRCSLPFIERVAAERRLTLAKPKYWNWVDNA